VSAEKRLRVGFQVQMSTKYSGEKNLLIVFIVILPRLENHLWLRIYLAKQIKLINLYPKFEGTNKRKIILDTFIFGDLHWNKKGTQIIFDSLIKEINF